MQIFKKNTIPEEIYNEFNLLNISRDTLDHIYNSNDPLLSLFEVLFKYDYDSENDTELINNLMEILNLMFKYGCDIDISHNPNILTIYFNSKHIDLNIIKLLFKHISNFDDHLSIYRKSYPPFHYLVQNSKITYEILEFILNFIDDINYLQCNIDIDYGKRGHNPMYFALNNKNFTYQMIKLMYDKGGKPNSYTIDIYSINKSCHYIFFSRNICRSRFIPPYNFELDRYKKILPLFYIKNYPLEIIKRIIIIIQVIR